MAPGRVVCLPARATRAPAVAPPATGHTAIAAGESTADPFAAPDSFSCRGAITKRGEPPPPAMTQQELLAFDTNSALPCHPARGNPSGPFYSPSCFLPKTPCSIALNGLGARGNGERGLLVRRLGSASVDSPCCSAPDRVPPPGAPTNPRQRKTKLPDAGARHDRGHIHTGCQHRAKAGHDNAGSPSAAEWKYIRFQPLPVEANPASTHRRRGH
jgi:hypothetical protein